MIADPASRLAARAAKRTYLPFDYPPTFENPPHWGYGRPQHARCAQVGPSPGCADDRGQRST
jgi:hypothetical protein